MNGNIKKGDNVMVISGKDKGKSGKVLKVDRDGSKVYVEGANMVKKAIKPRSAQQKGGIIDQEGKIDSSNVMLICPACGKVVRVGAETVTEDGKTKKIRVCKKCGASMEAKKAAAKKAAKKAAKAKKVAEQADVADVPADNKD